MIDDQKKISKIWGDSWMNQKVDLSVVNNRFFVESYPNIFKHIPKESKKILELASGTGRYGVSVARDMPEAIVYISDITNESLDLSKKLSVMLGIKNVDFSIQNCNNIKFEDNFFDVVFVEGVIQLFNDYNKSVKEMIRVLKPGGVLIVAVPNFWNFHTLFKFYLKLIGKKFEFDYEKSFKKKELRDVFLNNNLEVVSIDGFYVGYGIYRLKKYYRIFNILGRIVNRISKLLDRCTNNFFTNNFGFDLIIVGKK